MYKSKVHIHKNVEEILNNKSPYWIDFTFTEKPENGDIITVTEDVSKDIEDDLNWTKNYGPGKYIIHSCANIFDPKIHDGFSFCVMALKVQ